MQSTFANAPMSTESTANFTASEMQGAEHGGPPVNDAAWRSTFAAAQRVIDHHRANLETRMTIQRLRREERRAVEAVVSATMRG